MEEAQQLVLERAQPLRAERVPLERAAGRVLAEQREDWSRFVAALGQVAGVKYA